MIIDIAKIESKKGKLYNVQIRFPNPKADTSIMIMAKNKNNAFWVASEAKFQRGLGMGQIGEISLVK